MLAGAHRIRSSRLFGATVRRGTRAGTRTLVLHLDPNPDPVGRNESPGATAPRVGFVVSRAVGTAVVRNKVKRRLRNLARERLSSLPGSAALVVRALPASAEASYAELGADFDSALSRVLARSTGQS